MRYWRFVAVLALLFAAGCRQWVVEGWATSTAETYNQTEITEEALEDAVENLNDYRTVFFNHKHDKPIGHIDMETYLNGKMWVKIVISKSEPEIWRQVRDGILTGFSIGFWPLESEPAHLEELDVQGRLITRMRIIEVSLVSIPANPDCRITAWYVEW